MISRRSDRAARRMTIAALLLSAALMAIGSAFAGSPAASSDAGSCKPCADVAASTDGSTLSISTDRGAPIVIRQTAGPISQQQTLAIDGSRNLIVTWNEARPGGGVASMYSFSLDGLEFSRPLEATNLVRLRYAEFDPKLHIPETPAALTLKSKNAAAGGASVSGPATDEPTVYIVQFIIPPLESMLNQLRAIGAKPHIFLPDQAEIVTMTAAMRDRVAALPFVRWVGEYHPAYRMDDSLREPLADDPQSLLVQRYSIELLERGPIPQQAVVQRINALGNPATVQCTIPQGFRVQAILSGAQALEVARMPEVQFIEPMGEAGVDMNIARQIGGAVPLLSGLGYTGQGVRGEVMDAGIRLTHQAFKNPGPLVHGIAPPLDSHGTSTFGCVFGDGAVNANGTGMLPDREQGIFATYDQLTSQGGAVSRYDLTAELIDPKGPYRAVFQSNSWGNFPTTTYDTLSAEMDDILFNNEILDCQSQSNNGSTSSRPEAWAKNLVSIGGVTHFNTLSRTDDRWTSASFGPATDGRIKPDLAHFYDNVLCPTGTSDTAYNSAFNGTSAATPIVAGHFGLLFQMWHQGVFAGFGGGASVFADRPHMSTAKAMMINSAYRYDWTVGGSNATLTRIKQGWGMPDLAKLYDDRDKTFIVNETDLLAPGASKTYQFNVAPATAEFRVTMVYTDPKGDTASSVDRINDLTLQVTSPANDTYWGNVGLNIGNNSRPNGAANTVDTVENVFLPNPASGMWTVKVFGDVIVQDAHLETPEVDADYALVVAGVTPVIKCIADVNGDSIVNIDDLVLVITNWGATGANPADLNHDNIVDISDLVALITHWGPCP